MSRPPPLSSPALHGRPLAVGRSLEVIVDDIGYGWCQHRLTVLGGGVYYVTGEIGTLIFLIPDAIAKELGLSPYQRAGLVTAFLCGSFLGNTTSFLSDRYLGRRKPILVCYAQMLVLATAATFMHSFWPMVMCLFALGTSGGFGVPAWNSLCTETSPRDWRIFMNGLSQSMWNVATISVLLVILYLSPDLTDFSGHWRSIMLTFRVPNALLLGLSLWPGFVTSARWHQVRGEKYEAQEVLDQMRKQNAAPLVPIDLADAPPPTPQHMQRLPGLSEAETLFARSLRCVLFVSIFSTFTLAFVSSGISYAFPILAPKLQMGVGPVAFLIVSSCFEVAGIVVSIYTTATRKKMICIYLWGAAAGMAAFVGSILLKGRSHELALALMPVGLLTCNFFVAIGWIVVYTYVGEAFPTKVRSCAAGVIMATGRLGTIVAPWAFEYLGIRTGNFMVFFASMATLIVGNALAVNWFLPETKGHGLEDMEDEVNPLRSSPAEKLRYV